MQKKTKNSKGVIGMTAAEFKDRIVSAMPEVNRKHVYFSQTATAYYADFRPEYPEKSAADFLVTGNHATGKITLTAETAAVPTVKEYENFEQLCDDLKAMELCSEEQKGMKPTEVFKEMLDVIEFRLVKCYEGYRLEDLQGANLGDIESERFQNASQIVERLDVYINDYYLEDLDDEAEQYGLLDSVMALGLKEHSVQAWLDLAEKFKGDPEVDKFVESHKHEFDVLDMIANHIEEVKLEDIVGGEQNEKD